MTGGLLGFIGVTELMMIGVIVALIETPLIVLGAMVARKAGLPPLWAVVLLVPGILPIALLVLGCVRWPALDRRRESS